MAEQKTILVVDDEPELRDMIQLRAQDHGFAVTTAENGAEALKKLRGGKIDLIICDVLMPVMDGFAFYKELKRDPVTAKIPVLILTARGKMEDSFKVLGVDDFIAKPFDGKVLMERVNKILSVAGTFAAEERAVPPEPVPVRQGAGKKVFVAGTDRETVQAIAEYLGEQNCRVETALSGQDTMLKAMKFAPSLLLLDVMMEDLDSSELIKALKSTDELRSMTVVTYCFYRMSEMGSEDVREVSLSIDAASEKCHNEGAREYLGRFNEGPFLKELQRFL